MRSSIYAARHPSVRRAALALVSLLALIGAAATAQTSAPQPEQRPGDLRSELAALDQEAFDLERAADQARLRIREAEHLWLAAQEELAAAPRPDEVTVERVAATRLSLQVAQRRLALLERRLARIEATRSDVELWHRVVEGGMSRRAMRLAQPDLVSRIEELEREVRHEIHRIAELEEQKAAMAARAAAVPAASAMADLFARQARDLDALIEVNREDLKLVGRRLLVPRRTLAEIRSRTGEDSAGDRIAKVATSARRLWNYELVEVENSPITLGRTLLALVLLFVGFLLSKLIATVLGRRVFPRMGMDEGGSVAFQTLIFYLSLTAFFLWSLRVVHIPLTVFTVLGGALAIGVGFGSQNIVNNFISGLILLTERPIKVGDLVEVSGTYGEVERIGPRSTRIRSGDNTHVIVPNSWFLENSVFNWTLADTQIRAFVTVGVAYGTDTRQVEELLLRATAEHPAVFGEPPSEVLFTEFGDNALQFQVHFWIQASSVMERKRIESGLRKIIDARFRDAGITIAFPQRDVHLDASSPVPVRVVGDGGPTPTASLTDPDA